jgi:hypothetical protein
MIERFISDLYARRACDKRTAPANDGSSPADAKRARGHSPRSVIWEGKRNLGMMPKTGESGHPESSRFAEAIRRQLYQQFT